MYQVVNNLSHQAGAHALRAGVDFLYNDDTITYPAIGSRRLHVLVARELPRRRLQQRRLHADVRRDRRRADEPERRRLRAGRVEGQLALTLNAGLRYDLQFLETINTDTEQRLAARRASPGRRSTSRRTVVRGSAGLFYDRVPLRALANALLSAGNTTDLDAACGRSASACRRRRPARRCSRTSCAAAVPSVTLVNLTTMDRDLQNAYSRQASVEVEQQLGDRSDGQRRLSVPARRRT